MPTDGIDLKPINLHVRARRGGPTKVCNRCGQDLPEVEFMKWWSPTRQRMRRSPYCHACRGARHREARLRKEYGLTVEEYDALLTAQNGRCAICQRKPPRIFVDHCHTTGRNRGLLCINCNSLIGQAKDSVEILRAAIAYLERSH